MNSELDVAKQRTLGAPRKMLYDSKMMKSPLLSLTCSEAPSLRPATLRVAPFTAVFSS
jgi:hypothetical protein